MPASVANCIIFFSRRGLETPWILAAAFRSLDTSLLYRGEGTGYFCGCNGDKEQTSSKPVILFFHLFLSETVEKGTKNGWVARVEEFRL